MKKQLEINESVILYDRMSVAVPSVDDETIERVRNNFGGFAEKMLLAKAEIVKTISDIIRKADDNYPESTGNIPIYEELHKELKKTKNRLHDEVKAFTNKLNEAAAAMRAPVNILEEYIKDWEAALLEVKLKAKAEEERIKNIQIEQARVKQQFYALKADYISKSKDRAIKAFDDICEKVLAMDNAPKNHGALASVVVSVVRNPKFRGKEYFREMFMKSVNFVYTKPDDYPELDFDAVEAECLDTIRQIIIDNVGEWARQYMEGKVERVLAEQTLQKVEEKIDKIQVEAQKGQFTYTDVDIVESGKPIKKYYEMALPENTDNTLFIIGLFLQHKMQMYNRIKDLRKPYSITVERMKKYLEDAINDGDIEAPNGVVLNEVNKL